MMQLTSHKYIEIKVKKILTQFSNQGVINHHTLKKDRVFNKKN